MCTLTWTRRDGGYVLLFNRDERLTRLPGLPPREDGARVRWIAPIDADFGGTWIAANERGVTVGLMNGPAHFQGAGGSPRSRGLLVRDLAESESVAAFLDALGALDLTVYRAFRIFAIAPDEPLVLAAWDGTQLAIDRGAEARRPIVSLVLRDTHVESSRREVYARIAGNGAEPAIDRLEEFHRSHLPERGAASPCMHRDDAATLSLTRIVVCPDEVSVIVHDGSPCLPAPVQAASLARAVAGPDDFR